MRGNKVIQLTGRFNDLVYPGITEFDDPACFDINQVVMLDALKCFLILGYIFSELVFDYQVAFEKKFHRIV